jgi:hypothetical protein
LLEHFDGFGHALGGFVDFFKGAIFFREVDDVLGNLEVDESNVELIVDVCGSDLKSLLGVVKGCLEGSCASLMTGA